MKLNQTAQTFTGTLKELVAFENTNGAKNRLEEALYQRAKSDMESALTAEKERIRKKLRSERLIRVVATFIIVTGLIAALYWVINSENSHIQDQNPVMVQPAPTPVTYYVASRWAKVLTEPQHGRVLGSLSKGTAAGVIVKGPVYWMINYGGISAYIKASKLSATMPAPDPIPVATPDPTSAPSAEQQSQSEPVQQQPAAPVYVTCDKCNGSGQMTVSEQCSFCRGRGTLECNSCYGRGRIQCSMCWGKGYILNFNRTRTVCNACNGQGYLTCTNCNGSGRVQCGYCNGSGSKSVLATCDKCKGTGKVLQGS